MGVKGSVMRMLYNPRKVCSNMTLYLIIRHQVIVYIIIFFERLHVVHA